MNSRRLKADTQLGRCGERTGWRQEERQPWQSVLRAEDEDEEEEAEGRRGHGQGRPTSRKLTSQRHAWGSCHGPKAAFVPRTVTWFSMRPAWLRLQRQLPVPFKPSGDLQQAPIDRDEQGAFLFLAICKALVAVNELMCMLHTSASVDGAGFSDAHDPCRGV